MGSKVHFVKMHGAGNDYIYVDTDRFAIDDAPARAISWSDRRKGIGSDGLVLFSKSKDPDADYSMRIFNADGSEADMCGNASRCIGRYLYETGLCKKNLIRIRTASGIKNLWIKVREDADDRVESVVVDMLEPVLENRRQFSGTTGRECPLKAAGKVFCGMFVSMGNPHFVVFVDNLQDIDLCTAGPALEHHEAFAQRCNIEFAQVLSRDRIRVKVWERGSGLTAACGSGACATAVAAALSKRADKKLTVVMDGGELSIEWNPPVGHVYLSGPAEIVYEGDIDCT